MIYLDNAATTKPSAAAVKAMCEAAEIFGNPSSLHALGLQAEKLIEKSRETISEILGVPAKTLYFTSGGTEANNTAIFGTAYGKAKLGKHLITTEIEHPSVLSCFKRLENEGFEVTYLSADSDGRISSEELKKELRDDTTLVSIMYVNNETGVIQPIEEIGEILKNSKALFHSDCVQAFGKIPVKPNKMGVDMVTISAHKINGFKGTGALYVGSSGIRPLIYGGEQQKEFRPGTENVAGIAAFGAAAGECSCDNSKMLEIREALKKALLDNIDNIKINGSDEYNSGSVLNVSFIGTKAEILLHSLERYKIYVSTGSACSSHKPQPSHVLQAMGLSKKEIDSAIRISFGNEEFDISEVVSAFKKETEQIRRFVR